MHKFKEYYSNDLKKNIIYTSPIFIDQKKTGSNEKILTFNTIKNSDDIRYRLAWTLDSVTDNSVLIMRDIFKNKSIIYNRLIKYDNIMTIEYIDDSLLFSNTDNIIKYSFQTIKPSNILEYCKKLYNTINEDFIIKEIDKSDFIYYWLDFLDNFNKKIDKTKIYIHEKQSIIDNMLSVGFKLKDIDYTLTNNPLNIYYLSFTK